MQSLTNTPTLAFATSAGFASVYADLNEPVSSAADHIKVGELNDIQLRGEVDGLVDGAAVLPTQGERQTRHPWGPTSHRLCPSATHSRLVEVEGADRWVAGHRNDRINDALAVLLTSVTITLEGAAR